MRAVWTATLFAAMFASLAVTVVCYSWGIVPVYVVAAGTLAGGIAGFGTYAFTVPR